MLSIFCDVIFGPIDLFLSLLPTLLWLLALVVVIVGTIQLFLHLRKRNQ